jgi:hypothetical protein
MRYYFEQKLQNIFLSIGVLKAYFDSRRTSLSKGNPLLRISNLTIKEEVELSSIFTDEAEVAKENIEKLKRIMCILTRFRILQEGKSDSVPTVCQTLRRNKSPE